MFQAGTIGLAAASVAGSLAPDSPSLIAARAAQGLAAALLVPNSLALLSAAFPKAEHERAVGRWSAATTVVGAVSPMLEVGSSTSARGASRSRPSFHPRSSCSRSRETFTDIRRLQSLGWHSSAKGRTAFRSSRDGHQSVWRGTSSRLALDLQSLRVGLFRTVLLDAYLGCLARMVRGVLVVAVGRVRMVSGLFVLPCFVMPRCFFLMACGFVMMLGSFAMVLCGLLW
jgi:MFS family permease